jgi:intein/homing endonuclease
MGIKHLFVYIKNNFDTLISKLKKDETCMDIKNKSVNIDNLLVDMNGVFHNSTQKIYEYGNYKKPKRMLRSSQKQNGFQLQRRVFEDVCKSIEELVRITNPQKRIVLCVDGPAPLAKQCITGDSLVTMSNGFCKPIKHIRNGDYVLGYNGVGYNSSKVVNLQYNGEKKIVKIRMYDGRVLKCTKDHRILIARDGKNVWEEAYKINKTDSIVCGIVENKIGIEVIKECELTYLDSNMSNIMDIMNMKSAMDILVFSRIIGYILSHNKVDNSNGNIVLSTTSMYDTNSLVADIYLLTHKKPAVSISVSGKYCVYKIKLPKQLYFKFINIPGIVNDATESCFSIPFFLLDNCPKSIIREFLGGLLGKNGESPNIYRDINGDYSFTQIKFSQSIIEKCEKSLSLYIDHIIILFSKIDIYHVVKSREIKYIKNVYNSNNCNNIIKYTLSVPLSDNYIDFKYSINKKLRLTMASVYLKTYKNNVNNGDITKKSNYVCSYIKCICRNICDVAKIKSRIVPEYIGEEISLDEIVQKNLKLNVYDFLKMTNTLSWFIDEKGLCNYAMRHESLVIPYYILCVSSIIHYGKDKVYDIEVDTNHSFLANGLCVHNCQQRQRRFISVIEKEDDEFSKFDTNSITPGTKFMDYLSKYIDWYIRKRICEDSLIWKNVDVIFSNEKSPGEGEYKLMNFIRFYADLNETFCINGLDADLIMLSLISHRPSFYIIREELYDKHEFNLVNIGGISIELVKKLKWDSDSFDPMNAIDDFVFLCFLVGNDFLPHIPGIEILSGGIDSMIEILKSIGLSHGHLTSTINGNITINIKQLQIFFATIGLTEKTMLQDKLDNKQKFFPDELLEKYGKLNEKTKYELDIEGYKKDFYKTKTPEIKGDVKELCHEYIEGLQWVISYYTTGCPNWKWCFKHHYAPFASDVANNLLDYNQPKYNRTTSNTPFQQLLCVLPPKSANLIPLPLSKLLTDENSPLQKWCPRDVKIDSSGVRRKWESKVLLPFCDSYEVNLEYDKYIDKVDSKDSKRDKLGASFVYRYTEGKSVNFNSYYGNIIDCCVTTEKIIV